MLAAGSTSLGFAIHLFTFPRRVQFATSEDADPSSSSLEQAFGSW